MEKNRALHQEPRYEPAIVIPLKQEASLIDWLKSNNRLIMRETATEPEVAPGEEIFDDLIETEEEDFDDTTDEEDI